MSGVLRLALKVIDSSMVSVSPDVGREGALKKEIAQRYEHAEKEARTLSAGREQEQVRRRRREDPR